MEYTQRAILTRKLDAVRSHIYRNIIPIGGWESREERYIEGGQYQDVVAYAPFPVGGRWFCGDGVTRRFRATAEVPEPEQGLTRVLVLDMGGEGQVRIGGRIVSGVTSYHPGGRFREARQRDRVYLPDEASGRIEIEVECCLNFLEFGLMRGNGELGDEYMLRTAFYAEVDDEIEGAYFDFLCAAEAMDAFENPAQALVHSNAQRSPFVKTLLGAMDRDSYLHDAIADALIRAITRLDVQGGAEALRKSCPEARRALWAALSEIPYKAHAMVKFVGQAHIDTAWLWPIKESIRKCGKTFSNVLSLMDRYPEFTFAFSQPQLFAYTEAFYPELFEGIRRRVAEGRIELVGNAWVEMDTNVPSGESLVRQLLYGRQYFLDKFGKCSSVFWMPDVFGYSWALPQIMKRSGVDYFYTSKLVNNDTNRFPHSLFMWQGVDGTKILSYLQRLNYNGVLNAGTLDEIHQLFDQKAVCPEALMTIGHGDGGGGPSYQMLENGRRLKNFPGLPKSEFGTSLSFFREAEKVEDQLPVWNDEMYYEFHRGTYTSQANNKKNNRKIEMLLRSAEMACSFAHVLLGEPYPAKAFADAWKIMLTNQFHDILPGSSIREVYDDCDRTYAQAFAAAQGLYEGAMHALDAAMDAGEGAPIEWNFLSWPSGSAPSLGCATLKPSEGPDPTADARKLENEFLRVELDGGGNIVSLYDKSAGREVLSGESPSNLLEVFEDMPHRESAWNIDLEYQNKGWALTEAKSIDVIERGPGRAAIRVVKAFGKSTITQRILLGRGARRVDFETVVDWRETEKMLKAAFFPAILSTKATYEIQFGAIERPTHWNTSYDKARFEVCGHKWADLSEGRYGVSLLNDCKYGYDIKENRMRLTLLRSPNYPDPNGDKGVHSFTYSIYPHQGDWRVGGTVEEAYRLNVPTQVRIAQGGARIKPFSFANVDMPGAVIDTIKGAEDGNGIIVRMYESEGARGEATVRFCFPVSSVSECNLMEQDEHDVRAGADGFSFTIKPFEIKTFRVHPGAGACVPGTAERYATPHRNAHP